MRLVYQRVRSARVEIDGEETAAIGPGALLLLGICPADTEEEGLLLARKAAQLRVFTDEADKMNLSLLDVGGSALVVSNFTLYADCRHGRRPAFTGAAGPEHARPLYERFAAQLQETGVREVRTGRFGADMQVSLLNDGPVTVWLDTDELKKRG